MRLQPLVPFAHGEINDEWELFHSDCSADDLVPTYSDEDIKNATKEYLTEVLEEGLDI